jgi:hypothetical protein
MGIATQRTMRERFVARLPFCHENWEEEERPSRIHSGWWWDVAGLSW